MERMRVYHTVVSREECGGKDESGGHGGEERREEVVGGQCARRVEMICFYSVLFRIAACSCISSVLIGGAFTL